MDFLRKAALFTAGCTALQVQVEEACMMSTSAVQTKPAFNLHSLTSIWNHLSQGQKQIAMAVAGVSVFLIIAGLFWCVVKACKRRSAAKQGDVLKQVNNVDKVNSPTSSSSEANVPVESVPEPNTETFSAEKAAKDAEDAEKNANLIQHVKTLLKDLNLNLPLDFKLIAESTLRSNEHQILDAEDENTTPSWEELNAALEKLNPTLQSYLAAKQLEAKQLEAAEKLEDETIVRFEQLARSKDKQVEQENVAATNMQKLVRGKNGRDAAKKAQADANAAAEAKRAAEEAKAQAEADKAAAEAQAQVDKERELEAQAAREAAVRMAAETGEGKFLQLEVGSPRENQNGVWTYNLSQEQVMAGQSLKGASARKMPRIVFLPKDTIIKVDVSEDYPSLLPGLNNPQGGRLHGNWCKIIASKSAEQAVDSYVLVDLRPEVLARENSGEKFFFRLAPAGAEA